MIALVHGITAMPTTQQTAYEGDYKNLLKILYLQMHCLQMLLQNKTEKRRSFMRELFIIVQQQENSLQAAKVIAQK